MKKTMVLALIGALLFVSSLTVHAESNDLDILKKYVFGKWEITNLWAYPFVSEFNDERVAAHIGSQFYYNENLAISYWKTPEGEILVNDNLENPYYILTTMSLREFGHMYRVPIHELDYDADTIIEVHLYEDVDGYWWTALGNVVFIKDENTLIIWNGALFEAKRIEDGSVCD